MKYTHHEYIKAGYQVERASIARARAVLERIRHMMEQEHPDDRAMARHLVEAGKKEARQTRRT
jgi:hypothetical protein